MCRREPLFSGGKYRKEAIITNGGCCVNGRKRREIWFLRSTRHNYERNPKESDIELPVNKMLLPVCRQQAVKLLK